MNVSDGSQNMNNTRQGERAEWRQSGAVNRTSISPFSERRDTLYRGTGTEQDPSATSTRTVELTRHSSVEWLEAYSDTQYTESTYGSKC